MDTITDRRYPGHQRDIGHTLQLTLSMLLRVERDPDTGEQRFADPDELQLAGGLLRELKTAAAFCTMAEREHWAVELPLNLKPLCQELALMLSSLGIVDDEVGDDADEDEDELDEVDADVDVAPERPLTLPEIAVLVDEEMRGWARSLNVLLPQIR